MSKGLVVGGYTVADSATTQGTSPRYANKHSPRMAQLPVPDQQLDYQPTRNITNTKGKFTINPAPPECKLSFTKASQLRSPQIVIEQDDDEQASFMMGFTSN